MSTMTEQSAGSPAMANSLRAKLAQSLAATKPNAYIGTLGVFLGAGIATLNGRLITVGLADMRGALGLGVDEAAWIPTAYNMALMFMGPLSVYLGALFGPRRVLLSAAAIFVLASILLPFSPNLNVMLVLQVISGLASGTFYPLTLTYALRSLPLRYVIFGIGVYSMDILGVTNFAVPLEAWFTEHLSWHWIFWFSALVTPLMMFCIYRAIPNPPKRPSPTPALSWHGFLYASFALSLIYGALDQGERLDWLHSGVIVGMLATSAFLIAVAAVGRWIAPNPMVNLRFLARRNTLILAASLFSFRFVMLAVALLIPGFLGAIQGYRPLETGRVLLWVVVPQLALGVIAARLMRRFDGRLILATGFAVVASACLMNAQLTSAWAGDDFRISQVVIAIGLSFTFVGLVGCFVQQALDTGALVQPINVLTYAAFIHTVRILGGEIGTAVVQRLLSLREQYHSNMIGLHVASGDWLTEERLRALTGGLSPNSPGIEDAQGRAALVLGGQIKSQAYTLAYSDAFRVVAIVAAIAIVLIALMKPMKIYFDASSAEPAG
ncbi:MAG: Permease of the major facilitator superfamily [Chthonomonadaceae bacterium]|nr:Permease of the major facilitator superfamily [Chthonomonadaceae bacterium]